MAKVRSPNYPMMDFGAALGAARKAYEKDHRNKMSRAVLAKHLGHESLSGPALGKIGALRAYGLIDGNGDDLRITEEAVHALMAPEGSSERTTAITQLAMRPKLFQDIRKEFPGSVSPENLKFWLIKRDFVPDAAEKAGKVYLSTVRLVDGGLKDYDSGEESAPETPMTPQVHTPAAKPFTPPPAKAGTLQEVFNLEEGPVTLIVPATLSAESYEDLEAQFELFLRRAKRRVAKAGDEEAPI